MHKMKVQMHAAESKRRILSSLGVLCVVLVAALITAPACSSPSDQGATPPAPPAPPPPPPPPPPGANADKFVGKWANENPQTEGMTRVEITNRQNKINVHTWGSCEPKDCDQGSASTDVADSDDGTISVNRNAGFKEVNAELTVLSDGRLQVVEHSRYTDNSGRPDRDSTYYFKRATGDSKKESGKKQQDKKR